jgi:hypothetical protein
MTKPEGNFRLFCFSSAGCVLALLEQRSPQDFALLDELKFDMIVLMSVSAQSSPLVSQNRLRPIRLALALVASVAAIVAGNSDVYAQSTLMLYEPFNYSNIGSPVSSNTPVNWAYNTGTATNDTMVSSGNLSYSGLADSTGNSITNGGVGLAVRRLFGTGVNTGELFFSVLLKIDSLGIGVWNGAAAQVGAFTANDNAGFRLQIMVRTNSTFAYVFGVQKGGAGVTATFDTTEYHPGDTVLLVGKYDFTTTPNPVTLWINPSSSTFGAATPPATGFISATTGTDNLTIDRFNFRQNTAATVPPLVQWDELRVGTSWSAVTPLPGVMLTNVVRLLDGTFQFGYSDSLAQSVNVYASPDLASGWTSIGAPTEVSPGQYQFTDLDAPNHPIRFYQLRKP